MADVPNILDIPPSGAYVYLRDEKASGTAGGGFTSGSFQTRDLNTIVEDETGQVTLVANQFVLPAGKWRCNIRCPANDVDDNAARLQNITAASTILISGSGAAISASENNFCEIRGQFTIEAAQTLEVQHQCDTTNATDGFGEATGIQTEVFCQAEFIKVG